MKIVYDINNENKGGFQNIHTLAQYSMPSKSKLREGSGFVR